MPRDALGASDAAAGQWAKISCWNSPRSRKSSVTGAMHGPSVSQPCRMTSTLRQGSGAFVFPAPRSRSNRLSTRSNDGRKEWIPCTCLSEAHPPERASIVDNQAAATGAAIRPHVENSVSANAGELLSGADDAWEHAARQYHPMMAIIARSLSPGFTTAAVRWRQQIAP